MLSPYTHGSCMFMYVLFCRSRTLWSAQIVRRIKTSLARCVYYFCFSLNACVRFVCVCMSVRRYVFGHCVVQSLFFVAIAFEEMYFFFCFILSLCTKSQRDHQVASYSLGSRVESKQLRLSRWCVPVDQSIVIIHQLTYCGCVRCDLFQS